MTELYVNANEMYHFTFRAWFTPKAAREYGRITVGSALICCIKDLAAKMDLAYFRVKTAEMI